MKVTFDELYDLYHQDLFRFIFYMVKDRQVTEDLVQEVYVKVLQSEASFQGLSSKKTWLLSIARHTTLDYFRSQKRTKKQMASFFDWSEKGETLQADQPFLDDLVIDNEQMALVYHYLDHCPIDQRSILILRFIQSCSIRETAQILNCTEGKVKTGQHRGLKTLKAFLLKHDEERSKRE